MSHIEELQKGLDEKSCALIDSDVNRPTLSLISDISKRQERPLRAVR